MCSFEPLRSLPDEALRFTHCLGTAGQDVPHQSFGSLAGVLGDLLDQADAERGGGVEALTGEEVTARRLTDLGKDEWRDHGRNDPQSHLGKAEHRIRPCDGDVCTGHESRATAERISVDAAHHGRRARVDPIEHPEETHRILDVLVVGEVDRRTLPLDVGTGAEARALA